MILYGFAVGGAFFLWSEGRAHTSSGRREGAKTAPGRAAVRSWVGRGKNRKVRRAAVKADFFAGRQRPWARFPVGRIDGCRMSGREHAARARATVPDAQQPQRTSDRHRHRRKPPKAGSVPFWHRARPPEAGGGPWQYRKRSSTWKNDRYPRGFGNPTAIWGARVSSAWLPLAGGGRFATAAAADNDRQHREKALRKENAAGVSGGIQAGRCRQGRRAGHPPNAYA